MFSRTKLLVFVSSISLVLVCFANIRSSGAQTAQARAIRPISVLGDLIDITRANDERDNTRANAGTSNYAGMSITLDLGGEHNIIGVIQDHGVWATNYPGSYKVEVAQLSDGPWVSVFEGSGRRGESKALFEAIRGRFIRITATDRRGGGNDWSIAEVKAIIDPGATPRRFPRDEREPQIPREPRREQDTSPEPRTDRGIRDLALAFDPVC